MRIMVNKGSTLVKDNDAGAEKCFKKGYVHKEYNHNKIEKYVFPSPVHEWYVLQYWVFFLVRY